MILIGSLIEGMIGYKMVDVSMNAAWDNTKK
jgi:hypothetical protein